MSETGKLVGQMSFTTKLQKHEDFKSLNNAVMHSFVSSSLCGEPNER